MGGIKEYEYFEARIFEAGGFESALGTGTHGFGRALFSGDSILAQRGDMPIVGDTVKSGARVRGVGSDSEWRKRTERVGGIELGILFIAS